MLSRVLWSWVRVLRHGNASFCCVCFLLSFGCAVLWFPMCLLCCQLHERLSDIGVCFYDLAPLFLLRLCAPGFGGVSLGCRVIVSPYVTAVIMFLFHMQGLICYTCACCCVNGVETVLIFVMCNLKSAGLGSAHGWPLSLVVSVCSSRIREEVLYYIEMAALHHAPQISTVREN